MKTVITRLHCCLFIGLSLLLLGHRAYGAKETFISFEKGDVIEPGLVLVTTDDKYGYMSNNVDWQDVFRNKSVANRVTLKMDPYGTSYMGEAFSVSLRVEVSYEVWDEGSHGFITQTEERDFTINYTLSGVYADKSTFFISNGGNKLSARVLEYETFPANLDFVPNLILEAEIQVDRYYLLDADYSIPGSSLRHNSSMVDERNELRVTWDHVIGAEEYDVEWAHIYGIDGNGDDISIFDVTIDPLIFRVNSTRVTVSENYFYLPLNVDRGFIVYRVRPVGRDAESNFEWVWPANWSKDPGACSSLNLVSCMSPNVYAYEGLSQELNWMSSTEFIEKGKSKVNISYYDGTLRNRQDQVRINSIDQVLVGESFYDHDGRPAITTIPVPEDKKDIQFSELFTRNASGELYTKDDFEPIDGGGCLTGVPMDTQVRNGKTGASVYYSPFNPNKNGHQAYLADAAGYAFTQSQYTLDNTGRVRAMAGPGAYHHLGSGHETKYYFGQPFQEELDRLFGLDVGFDKHYQKNMIIDPNGQVSITYLNSSGNPIATALAGAAPTGLDELDGVSKRDLFIDLLSKNNPSDPMGTLEMYNSEGTQRTMNRNYITSMQGPHQFHYDNQASTYEADCEEIDGAPSSPKCYNCVVDVEIHMIDDCGDDVFPGLAQNGASKVEVGPQSIDCEEETILFSYDTSNVVLEPGSYQISKIVTINQEALDVYTADYLDPSNNCLIPFETFLEEELLNIDTTGCNITCETCLEEIGVFPSWDLNDYNIDHNPNCDPCLNESQYDELLGTCDALCFEENPSCEVGLRGMLSDVSPYGQYGGVLATTEPGISDDGVLNPDVNSAGMDPSVHPLSIFNVDNILNAALDSPSWSPTWKFPSSFVNTSSDPYHYYDEDGDIDKIQVMVLSRNDSTGELEFFPEIDDDVKPTDAPVGSTFEVEPQDLKDVLVFLTYWKSSWAESLVKYHPEYGYYEICLKTEASHQFDAKWLSISEVSLAAPEFGFGLDASSLPQPLGDVPANAIDPYFNPDSTLNPRFSYWEYHLMKTRMEDYLTDPVEGTIDIWKAAHIAANCPNYSISETSCPSCYDTFDGINSDEEWIQFRSLYISLKQSFQSYKNRLEAIKGDFYNGCIGEDDFDPSTLNIYDPASNGFLFVKYQFSSFFRSNQTCNVHRAPHFADKVKRFAAAVDLSDIKDKNNACYQELDVPADAGSVETLNFPTIDELSYCAEDNANTLEELTEKVDRILFEKCGQCPLSRDLQFLLDAIPRVDVDEDGVVTKPNQLVLSDVDINPSIDPSLPAFYLSCYPAISLYKEFTPDLEDSLNLPGDEAVIWKQLSVTNTQLEVAIQRQGLPEACNLTLTLSDTSQYSLTDITGICCLSYESEPVLLPLTPNRNFVLDGIVKEIQTDGKMVYQKVYMEGVSCINIAECPMAPVCENTLQVETLETLFDALVSDDNFNMNGGAIDILSPTEGEFEPYSSIVRGKLDNGVLSGDSWEWTSIEANATQLNAAIKDVNSSGSAIFEFYLPPDVSFSFDDIIAIENLKVDSHSEDSPENYFVMEVLARTSDGNTHVAIAKGYSPMFQIGTCRSVVAPVSNDNLQP